MMNKGLIGLTVYQVDPGTVVIDDFGCPFTVTDEACVVKGSRIYVTPLIYQEFLDSPQIKVVPTEEPKP